MMNLLFTSVNNEILIKVSDYSKQCVMTGGKPPNIDLSQYQYIKSKLLKRCVAYVESGYGSMM